MDINTDLAVFLIVILGRLGLPLLIPRFPLPAIIACMVLDTVDQTIFQRFTSLDLTGYQSYDKALDIYYLSIAYIATLRNWVNIFAFRASKFLLYYRLVGVTLFELTGLRGILLIFPNTFEYFFIFYHAISLRWNPRKYSKRLIIGAIAFIWIFIKLPQEWWIHIAKFDVTETLNEYLFKMPPDTPMPEAFLSNMGITITIILAIIVIILAGRWYVLRKLPVTDTKLAFSFKMPDIKAVKAETKNLPAPNFIHSPLFEKIILVGLVSTIFSMMLPEVKASALSMFLMVGIIVALNSSASHLISMRTKDFLLLGLAKEFFAMLGLNLLIVISFVVLLPSLNLASINWQLTSFFLLLITIFITMFDRYFPVHQYLALREIQK